MEKGSVMTRSRKRQRKRRRRQDNHDSWLHHGRKKFACRWAVLYHDPSTDKIEWAGYDDDRHTPREAQKEYSRWRREVGKSTGQDQPSPEDVWLFFYPDDPVPTLANAESRQNDYHQFKQDLENDPSFNQTSEKASFRVDKEGVAHFELKTRTIRELDQLLEELNVDTSEWQIEDWTGGKHDQGMKLKRVLADGTSYQVPVVTQLFHIRARFRPRVKERALELLFKEMKTWVKGYRRRHPRRSRLKRELAHPDGLMLKIDNPDLHFGRQAEPEITGYEYNLERARQLEIDSVAYHLEMATGQFPIKHVLMPVGNDRFNVDNLWKTTSHGTSQEEVTARKLTWQWAKQSIIDAVELCLDRDVLVTLVPVLGNHEEDTMEKFADLLGVFWDDDPRVTVYPASTRQYVRYGANLIGLTHGYYEKWDELPGIMMAEQRGHLSGCSWLEFNTAHEHRWLVKDGSSVLIWTSPSMAAPSYWEHKKGYTASQRASESVVYRPDGGRVAHYPFVIEEKAHPAKAAIEV